MESSSRASAASTPPSPRCTDSMSSSRGRRLAKDQHAHANTSVESARARPVESEFEAPRGRLRGARRALGRRRGGHLVLVQQPGEWQERPRVAPSSAASSARRLECAEDAVVPGSARTGPGRSVIRDPRGASSPRRYLPVSQPPASGPKPGSDSPCSRQTGRHGLAVAAVEQASTRSAPTRSVSDLPAPRARPTRRAGRCEVGRSGRTDLPGAHELVEGEQGLLLRHLRVERVRHVERHALDAEAAGGSSRSGGGRGAGTGRGPAGVHRVERLGLRSRLVTDVSAFVRSHSPMPVSLRPPP